MLRYFFVLMILLMFLYVFMCFFYFLLFFSYFLMEILEMDLLVILGGTVYNFLGNGLMFMLEFLFLLALLYGVMYGFIFLYLMRLKDSM